MITDMFSFAFCHYKMVDAWIVRDLFILATRVMTIISYLVFNVLFVEILCCTMQFLQRFACCYESIDLKNI